MPSAAFTVPDSNPPFVLAPGGAAAFLPMLAPAVSLQPMPSTTSPPCSSGSGGYLQEEAREAACSKPGAVRNKGALAQKRFRERQKERMLRSQQQVEELTEQLGRMVAEKSRLETKTKILEQVVQINMHHEARLHCDKEIMVREQAMLLEDLAAFANLVNASHVAAASQPPPPLAPGAPRPAPDAPSPLPGAGPWGIEAIGALSLSAWMEQLFPAYIERLRHLFAAQQPPPRPASGARRRGGGGAAAAAAAAGERSSVDAAAAAAAAGAQVDRLMGWRREHEDRLALFSHFHWALYSCNRALMAAGCGGQAPGPDAWAALLARLAVTPAQEAALLNARHHLLDQLKVVGADWKLVLPRLALELLQVPKHQWHTCPGVKHMIRSLAQEREAVLAFTFTCEEALSPRQAALLEADAYPWCPDLWEVSGALAAARRRLDLIPRDDPLGELLMGNEALKALMPGVTAFQLLSMPLLAHGAGLRLKRALLICPFRTVLPAGAFPEPPLAVLQPMALHDVHCGSFFSVMPWDWLKTNLPGYLEALPAAGECLGSVLKAEGGA